MNLRDTILAHLRQPDYRPVDLAGLARLLKLPKAHRHRLAHETRQLLARGELTLVKGDRLALPIATTAAVSKGKIQFRQGGSAFVILPSEPGQSATPAVQIAPDDTGVALHGDEVEVRIDPGPGRHREGRGIEPSGRVVRVVSRAREIVVGRLHKVRSTFYVTPDDPRLIHDIVVPDPAQSRLDPVPVPNDKVVVKLVEWTQRHKLIQGEIVERLGQTFEPTAEIKGLYRKYNLDPAFPVEVQREAAALADKVRARDLAGRLDYREIPTFTIDPDDAKDFDDALSLEPLPSGELRIGIHIADVSAYVKPGSVLDREAHRRGNSTYLVGTVVPMLPEKLSNGLCSLVEAQDRLTKAVFLTFDSSGRIKHTSFGNTVIRSRKRLTYKQAYALLFENDLGKIRALPLPPKHQTGSTGRALSSLTDPELTELQNHVRKLWSIAEKLRHDRMAHGSLDLDMPETKVFVDEAGYADRLELIEHDESHQLIEEFMLAANEAVAHVTRVKRLPSLYRVHDDPDPEKLAELREVLSVSGITVGDLTQRKEVAKLLVTLQDHPQGHALRTQLLRSLRKACYRATPDGHYGLSKRDYTHFTSPIRRYADLVVHRVLEYYLIENEGYPSPAGYAFGYTKARMEAMGEHISLTEGNSQEAERESVKIKLLEFFERELAKKKKTVFAAIITDVRPHGFFVELVESMTFGFVPTNALPEDNYQLDASGSALVGRRSRQRFAVGDKPGVVVHKVDRFKRLIDFSVPK